MCTLSISVPLQRDVSVQRVCPVSLAIEARKTGKNLNPRSSVTNVVFRSAHMLPCPVDLGIGTIGCNFLGRTLPHQNLQELPALLIRSSPKYKNHLHALTATCIADADSKRLC